ncbi:serine/threonine-protein kinase [Mycobacteroides abscessus]|uniref:serine/threonine-protein kinase n=1 Tax=Mycobacteroides abscessus TaxID=36809 RepID=UPI0009269C63|nr:serine/threonine-protein kinase [Mycobacteroides abscessus]MBN7379724.1 protein kinase [Mycobacteroides abscessus subsp. massiliense]MDM2096368.1 protein kinase [Mycobacteroides abscessus]MDM2121099.1 protein kinase [Mycobacteroides abscessus]MDM2124406.1 protein kinase [Mycobacteroides abscessus]MDM2130591.1 protein kinase [Mycobacteroides abscessus]
MPLRVGERVAGYKVLRLLGSGGMGEVYLVQHPRLPRQDALKILRANVASDTSFRERFIREADLGSRLRHPHIVGIHDRGQHQDHLWIAMDYIDGTDVNELLAQRYPAGMHADLVVAIVSAVASALDYAHNKGLLHRDVKPANIIVADLGTDQQRIFLADFGIARPLDDSGGITTTNMTVGTVAYAAPEQLMGDQIDGRADLYALAATTYHLLTGAQLFAHSNVAVVISRHLNTPPPSLSDSRPDLADIDHVLHMALAKEPEDRYPSCTAFARSLADAAIGRTDLSSSAPTQEAPRQRRHTTPIPRQRSAVSADPKKRRVQVAVGGSVVTLLLIGLIAVAWQRPWNRPEAPAAQAHTVPIPASTTSPPTSTYSPSVAMPLPPTVLSPYPSAAITLPSVIAESPVADAPADEKGFLTATYGLPNYVIPNGRFATDGQRVASGYEACAKLDQYPTDSMRAARAFYPSGNQSDGEISYDGQMFMLYAANYLCKRHAHLYENF